MCVGDDARLADRHGNAAGHVRDDHELVHLRRKGWQQAFEVGRMTVSLNSGLPARRSDVWLRQAGDENAVCDPKTGAVHMLNSPALAIWHLCDGQTSPEEMVDAICEASGMPADVVVEDVEVREAFAVRNEPAHRVADLLLVRVVPAPADGRMSGFCFLPHPDPPAIPGPEPR